MVYPYQFLPSIMHVWLDRDWLSLALEVHAPLPAVHALFTGLQVTKVAVAHTTFIKTGHGSQTQATDLYYRKKSYHSICFHQAFSLLESLWISYVPDKQNVLPALSSKKNNLTYFLQKQQTKKH